MSKNYNNYNGFRPQEKSEPIEKVEEVIKEVAEEVVVEEVKEAAMPETPVVKTLGVIIAIGEDFTVVKIYNKSNLRVEGILGEIGDEVEVEVR